MGTVEQQQQLDAAIAASPTTQAMTGELQRLVQEGGLVRQAVDRIDAELVQLRDQRTQDAQTAAATTKAIQNSGDLLTQEVHALVQRLTALEQHGWQLGR